MVAGEEQQLLWEGRRTAEQAADALRDGGAVLLQLPADYNHALFERLHPRAAPGATESIDAEGGPELLDVVAQVSGLGPLTHVADAARAVGARVTMRSPASISIHPSD